ncbi:MAG: hypothetical protein CMJ31_05310 [Phycisphaerae bacterium]|nr:hypothetical protein [Phycisphaerae bacterium]
MIRIVSIAFAALVVTMPACVTETIYEEPPKFSEIPGATVRGVEVTPKSNRARQAPPPEAVSRLIENDDEEVIGLLSTSVRDLVANILYTIDEERADLFASDILSQITRDEFVERGHDPLRAFEIVEQTERPVRKLFTRMPDGEYTPGLFMVPQGRNVYRLSFPAERGYFWRGIDVVFEAPSWRLRWFVR